MRCDFLRIAGGPPKRNSESRLESGHEHTEARSEDLEPVLDPSAPKQRSLAPQLTPEAKEITRFIGRVELLMSSGVLEQLTTPTPFVRWPNGDLKREWTHAREQVRVEQEQRRKVLANSGFGYIATSDIGGAGIEDVGVAVIEKWATEAKLVGDDGTPLRWLVLWINQTFRGPTGFVPVCTGSPKIVGRWVMPRGWRQALSGIAENTPNRKSGSCTVTGCDALILALARGDWSGGSQIAAGRVARRLGMRWPLGLRKPGPGRGHRKTSDK